MNHLLSYCVSILYILEQISFKKFFSNNLIVVEESLHPRQPYITGKLNNDRM